MLAEIKNLEDLSTVVGMIQAEVDRSGRVMAVIERRPDGYAIRMNNMPSEEKN
jgi:hypothetical protein